jgi:hypothetical protein
MIINISWIVGLWVGGWSSRILYQDFRDEIKVARLRKRQQREDDEVQRIVSGYNEGEPEVDVASEQIRPTLRERLENWWVNLWLDSTPRTGEQVSRDGFRKPLIYAGRHRADKTLVPKGGEDGLPVAEEEVPRRDCGETGSGPRSQDDGFVHSGRAQNLPLPLV